MLANFCLEHADGGKNVEYTDKEKRVFREHTEVLHKMRKDIEPLSANSSSSC